MANSLEQARKVNAAPVGTSGISVPEDHRSSPRAAAQGAVGNCVITGVVLDPEGRPAAGVEVRLSSVVISDAAGRFRFDGLRPSAYTVSAGTWEPDTHGWCETRLPFEGSTADLTVRLRPLVTLELEFDLELLSSFLELATRGTPGQPCNTRSSCWGAIASLDGVAPGEYWLTVLGTDAVQRHVAARVPVTIGADTNPRLRVTLRPRRRVAVSVLDPSGLPVREPRSLWLLSEGLVAHAPRQCPAEGPVLLEPGAHRLVAMPSNPEEAAASLVVEADAHPEHLEVRLRPSTPVRVGLPVSETGLYVRVHGPAGVRLELPEPGSLEVSGLAREERCILEVLQRWEVERDGAIERVASLEELRGGSVWIEGGQPAPPIVLGKLSRVRGRVLDEAGAPAGAGIRVDLVPLHAALPWRATLEVGPDGSVERSRHAWTVPSLACLKTATDGSGAFNFFRGIPSGIYTLSVSGAPAQELQLLFGEQAYVTVRLPEPR